MSTNITEMNAQELKRMQEELKALKEKEEKAKARGKRYRDENKEKVREWSERARVRSLLLAKKAKEAGIEVGDNEIDEYLNSK